MKNVPVVCLLLLIAVVDVRAQRGNIRIPTGGVVAVPAGAQICADNIYANNPGFGTLTIFNAGCLCPGLTVVPVELLALSAAMDNGAVHVRWCTTAETNCAGFEVQRSQDQEKWQSIGFVPGHGTTALRHDYGHEDVLRYVAVRDVLYYRLKVVDTDGRLSYSPAVQINIGEQPPASMLQGVFPNPVSNCVTMSFSLSRQEDVSIAVFSMTGAEVIRLKANEPTARGSHAVSIPVAALPSGAYVLEFVAGDARWRREIVVRR